MRTLHQQGTGGMVLALILSFGCDKEDAAVASTAPPAKATAAPQAAASPISTTAQGTAEAVKADGEKGEPESIAAQHVLVAYRGADRAPRGVTRSKAQARKLAEEIVVKARKDPGDMAFAALAREYSDDEGTKNNLGNLGKFPKSKMVKSFSEPAFKLKVGEISDAVETPFGFHVIKRNQ